MHFFTLIAFVPIFGQFAHAAAVPVAQISAMDIVTITTYKDAGRSGASQTWSLATQSQCIGLSGTEWNDVISSVSIPTGYRCRFWTSNNCDSTSTPDIYAPGTDQFPSNMNDKTTSFKCYKN
ncbi:hypothetical protein DDE82_008268 [Stemphylium lycopersici]|uniref:Uncharacterized protein n=1 Tax=Stemphylium lycopersici TaxID=183478 RepID=A0A364N631_STELY|nr:hypothetical protein TW65_04444 [Stemphylium lycopersici]RAQ99448.1 hypothetical protein DDE82_008268 [Stemphylium lycopersici]RAR12257.1 hypothetical protein DDE83_004144 [Stemphylium lycopersici]